MLGDREQAMQRPEGERRGPVDRREGEDADAKPEQVLAMRGRHGPEPYHSRTLSPGEHPSFPARALNGSASAAMQPACQTGGATKGVRPQLNLLI